MFTLSAGKIRSRPLGLPVCRGSAAGVALVGQGGPGRRCKIKVLTKVDGASGIPMGAV